MGWPSQTKAWAWATSHGSGLFCYFQRVRFGSVMINSTPWAVVEELVDSFAKYKLGYLALSWSISLITHQKMFIIFVLGICLISVGIGLVCKYAFVLSLLLVWFFICGEEVYNCSSKNFFCYIFLFLTLRTILLCFIFLFPFSF